MSRKVWSFSCVCDYVEKQTTFKREKCFDKHKPFVFPLHDIRKKKQANKQKTFRFCGDTLVESSSCWWVKSWEGLLTWLLKCPWPQSTFFAEMKLCTCSKRNAASIRLQNLRKNNHLLFPSESEGEWVYSWFDVTIYFACTFTRR